jgi:pyruvate dehydrogenase E2 component (dihydrolipoamide acetyltransferase)
MTTPIALTIPKWGLSMEKGTVTSWLISEGDSFEAGQEIVEIESDKIANVVEAEEPGVLFRIVVEEGQTMGVGDIIGVVGDAGLSEDAIDAFLNESGTEVTSVSSENEQESTESRPEPVGDGDAEEQADTPKVGVGINIPDAILGEFDASAVVATSHATRLAKLYGIDLSKVDGTGRRGRISVEDLSIYVAESGGSLVIVPRRSVISDVSQSHSGADLGASEIDAPKTLVAVPIANNSDARREPLSSMRQTIASRLQQSKLAAPHFRVAMRCDAGPILSLRKRINESQDSVRVSVNDIILKASAMALMDVPECNVQFDGETIYYSDTVDVGVAVALEDGLIVPIVRDVQTKGLGEISREVKALAGRAREGALRLEDIEGGTFSVSNLGMFGVSHFDAIINPPQAAILAVGATEERLREVEGGVESFPELVLTLSSDHRVIDGAKAAKLLAAIRGYIEAPLLMMG